MGDGDERITVLIKSLGKGDESAAAELMPLVHDRLREMANAAFRHQPAGHTLEPTALVNEAYIRLAGSGRDDWAGRDHFFAVAATAMRQILVDHARRKRSLKRGGDQRRVTITGLPDADGAEELDVLDLDEALEELAADHERSARIVTLRFFGGMSEEAAARCVGVSRKTASQDWAYARAWLSRRLRDTGRPPRRD